MDRLGRNASVGRAKESDHSKGAEMLQEERFIKITGHLKEEGSDNYANMAKLLGVSEGTVRKDLAEMDKRGLVKLVRGGAAYAKNNLTRSQLDKRSMINREEKKQLVQELKHFVKNGQAIAINGGTTSIEAAKFLVKNYSELAVVTNNLTVVDILKSKKSFQIVVTGGIYYDRENTVIGKQCEDGIKNYNTDVALIALNSISLEKGVTDFRIEETGIINAMIQNTQRAIGLADHSKFDRIACMNVCGLEIFSEVLTDSKIKDEVLYKYKNQGINVIKAREMAE